MPLNEGQTVQYTVTTTNTADGTVLYWKTTGNTTNSDIVGGNTGSITITNNRAYINVTMASDESPDGSKTLGITLLTGSLNGTTVAATNPNTPITVNDTSNAPTILPTRLWMWGNNNYGKSGQNNQIYYSSPVQVGTETTWNNIAGADHYFDGTHTLATKTDGTLWAWGAGQHGRLGTNSQINRSSPVQVGSSTNWNRVAVGPFHSLATKTDGTLWSWGVTNDGRLGDGVGSGSYKSSPVQVGSGTTWNLIEASEKNGLATKTDGTLWAWGVNGSGQIGNFNTTTQTTPQQVSGSNWDQIALGAAHCLATKTDGTLWAWGENSSGQLGRGNQVNVSNANQVGSGTTWNKVAAAQSCSMAIKTDGTLWAWGQNSGGQLGVNDRIYRSSPVQVGVTTNWSQITVGQLHAVAIKTDGTLWAWGSGDDGRLGSNSLTFRSSPVQIGTNTNWSKILGGQSHTIAITSN